MSIGVLLVNLGTPDSPHPRDVKRYLHQFLTDGRVIDIPWLYRQLLVRGLIVPKRCSESAKTYRVIWKKEGSPLMVYGKQLESALQSKLGKKFSVRLAMRYQNPSIASGLEELKKESVRHLMVLPLFPHYASATTGSVHQEVLEKIRHWSVIPSLNLIQGYAQHPGLIEAIASRAENYDLESYDHLIFSYHGLPERHLHKVDLSGCCLKTPDCCQTMTDSNQSCYGAQCWSTTKALAARLRFAPDRYTHCYQSRLGKDLWVRPYTSEVIKQCAKSGKKRLLVFCPSFACDCLETLHEIGVEYRALFQNGGGEELDFVEGLNDHPMWIEALKNLIHEQLPRSLT